METEEVKVEAPKEPEIEVPRSLDQLRQPFLKTLGRQVSKAKAVIQQSETQAATLAQLITPFLFMVQYSERGLIHLLGLFSTYEKAKAALKVYKGVKKGSTTDHDIIGMHLDDLDADSIMELDQPLPTNN